jgi:error-prone DNA polymerase
MVATVNTMTARSAVRTAARAFGFTHRRGQRALAPPAVGQRAQVARGARDLSRVPGPPAARAALPPVLDIAERLDGCPMHLGTHLGGFIITREPIDTWTPLQWAAKGVVVSQYDKDDVEALGLVKMDILGLRMHSAITETVALVRGARRRCVVPETVRFPRRPARLRDDRERGHGRRVPAREQRAAQPQHAAARARFEDIIAAISLFRPGPLEAEMIGPFIRRRHGARR